MDSTIFRPYIAIMRTALVLIIAVFSGSCAKSSPVEQPAVEAVALSDGTSTESSREPEAVVSEPDSVHFSSLAEFDRYIEDSDSASLYNEGIIRNIADDNLKYAERLINSKYDYFIVVDKQRMKVIVYDNYGRQYKSYGMACAKNYGTKHKRGDSRTPEGFFAVKGVYDSSEWLYTDENGHTSQKKGQYGPKFIRLDIPGITSIGIHGTCAPWSIGRRSSHGCIRIKNENILELATLVKKGMPVIVSPGKRDMAVNREEGYDIPQISTRLHSVTERRSDDSQSKYGIAEAAAADTMPANYATENAADTLGSVELASTEYLVDSTAVVEMPQEDYTE